MENKFFTYTQNNSSGRFVSNSYLDQYVIIEAENSIQANKIAEDKGIYFDGCDSGIDCQCCGDRWYSSYEDDGKNEPLVYGDKPNKLKLLWGGKVIIHYLNGEIEVVKNK